MHGTLMLWFVEEGKKEFTYLQDELGSIIRLLEVESEGQWYMDMMNLEKIPIIHRGECSPLDIQDTDMIMCRHLFAQAREYVAGVGRFARERFG